MIYLDNAATTYPKPLEVNRAVMMALNRYGANPGRSGHKMSMECASEIYKCRKLASDIFNAKGPECIAFTLNCTHAINIVLKGLLKPGDHVVTSCLEHNAVMRPLKKMEEMGITHTCAEVFPLDEAKTVDSFKKAINPRTTLIACTHASNVWGVRLPISRIAELGKAYGIPILVDGAQAAGVVTIDMISSGIDYLCVPGHKGLYGPMGTGMMITCYGEKLKTLIEGGTGTNSLSLYQPDEMPEKFESGTPNMAGICGLRAGMEFIRRKGIKRISEHENRLVDCLYDELKDIGSVELYMPRPEEKHFVPVLSFNIEGYDSETVARILSDNNIYVRAGLHCAPSAHEFCGTIKRGVVRVCPSAFTSYREIRRLIDVVRKIPKKSNN